MVPFPKLIHTKQDQTTQNRSLQSVGKREWGRYKTATATQCDSDCQDSNWSRYTQETGCSFLSETFSSDRDYSRLRTEKREDNYER